MTDKEKDAAASPKEADGLKKSTDASVVDDNIKPSPADEENQLIVSLQKDPEGIRRILEEKRSANASDRVSNLKLKAYEATEAKKEEDALKEQNKWKELAEKREKRITELEDGTKLTAKQTALEKEALKEGIINANDVGLAKADNVTFDDKTGSVSGADKVIAELKKDKPYLFKTDSTKPQPKTKVKVDNTKPSPTPTDTGLKGRKKIVSALEKEDAERG